MMTCCLIPPFYSMSCAIHQTMLQSLPINGEFYKAKTLESLKKKLIELLTMKSVYEKKPSMPGDWVCESCQRQNFCWRQYCRNCNKPFVGEKGAGTQEHHGPRIICYRPGDWFCDAGVCRAHNYASRYNCFKCGAVKSMPSFGGSLQYYNHVFPRMNFGFYGIMGGLISRRGWMPGDWFCGRSDCNAHNYSSRMKCFKCYSSRELVCSTPN